MMTPYLRRVLVATVAGLTLLLLLRLLYTESTGWQEVKSQVKNGAMKAFKPEAKSKTSKPDVEQQKMSVLKAFEDSKKTTYRYFNGFITYWDENPVPEDEILKAMTPAELESMFERVAFIKTAVCTSHERYGALRDTGYTYCVVQPLQPQPPCFGFSYGIGNAYEYDDEVAKIFKCQMLLFDPSMKKKSYRRSERVFFFEEGISGKKGVVKGWRMDSFGGHAQRLGVSNHVIDVLKIDAEESEWPALETALVDGSLKNVKQLLMEAHVFSEEYLRYLKLMRRLHEFGFRKWDARWHYYPELNKPLHKSKISGKDTTCCFEMSFININLLKPGATIRNAPGTEIADPLGKMSVGSAVPSQQNATTNG